MNLNRCEEGKKVALLQQNSYIIQKDLEKIENIGNYIRNFENNSMNMLQFLINFKQLEEKVKSEVSKPLKGWFV